MKEILIVVLLAIVLLVAIFQTFQLIELNAKFTATKPISQTTSTQGGTPVTGQVALPAQRGGC